MKIIKKGDLNIAKNREGLNARIVERFLKRLKKNIYTVATNERAITGSVNVLCATERYITTKTILPATD
jgi:hypothetical protein